jgi:GT2 family glycosyltransferase
MKNNISLIVALKNNLEYNKHFYKTTRELYPELEICFSSYNSTDGTHEWLDSLNDPYTKVYHTTDEGIFSDNFNKATELATKEYVAYAHNDMVLAPGFIENLEKHVSPDTVVSYTTIEPPIFADHERPGKIIKDLGIELETFNLEELYKFTLEKQEQYKDKTEPGITFFMCMPKDKNLEIGGLDNLFRPMFCEDDDLILRFKLLGLNLITSLDSICYHFVSKTSRFSEDYKNKTEIIERNSNRNYIRKWGFRKSIHYKRYNKTLVINNCDFFALANLEPWADKIYIDDNSQHLASQYIPQEKDNTTYDLTKRIFDKKFNTPEGDIIIEFDAKLITQESFIILQNISDIIYESGKVGKFQVDIFNITINNMKSYEDSLIKVSN